ncbi:MAG: ankyrin repeat domain-containing protein [Proteobacteria bacterium]|nr:MAG: ankyrin repeat domain-containing protein [Pseudomonadota bacterium]
MNIKLKNFLCIAILSLGFISCVFENVATASANSAYVQTITEDATSDARVPTSVATALKDFVGYWKMQEGTYTNVLRIQDEISYNTHELETRIAGLDFTPEFGYRPAGNFSNDVPVLEYNSDRKVFEALLMKKIGKDSVIFETTIKLLEDGSLELRTVDGRGHEMKQTYRRVERWNDGQAEYQSIADDRTTRLFEEAGKGSCTQYDAEDLKAFSACTRSLISEGKLTAERISELFYRSVEFGDINTLRLIISQGIDLNAQVGGGSAPRELPMRLALTNSNRTSWLGEHGMPSGRMNSQAIQKLFITAGADISADMEPFGRSTLFEDAFMRTNDLDFAFLLLSRVDLSAKYIREAPPLWHFFYGWDRWEGKGGPVLEKLLAMGANPNEKFSDNSGSALEKAVSEGDLAVLQILKANGADFKATTRNGTLLDVARKELSDLQKYEKADAGKGERLRRHYERRFRSLRENIAFLEKI